jgi:hypothetical protein
VLEENDGPAQSLALSSPSSISQSGLMKSPLPANVDRDWYGESP